MGANSNRKVQATKTSLRIIEALAELDGCGVTELSNHLDISKGAVHKHLQTLVNQGYVSKSRETYNIGLRFFHLGTVAKRRRTLFNIGRSPLKRIVNMIDAHAALVVAESHWGIYLLVENQTGRDDIPSSRRYEGAEMPLLSTAPGKVILAHGSESNIESVIESHSNNDQSDNTANEKESLLSELERIQIQGVAIDEEDFEPGWRSVAAPIIGPKQCSVGAIEVIGDVDRITSRRFRNEISRLADVTAQRVSKQLSLELK